MARSKGRPMLEVLQEELMWDVRTRHAMAELICELREANDPDLEMKEAMARDAMRRLAVSDIELFDDELRQMEEERKAAK